MIRPLVAALLASVAATAAVSCAQNTPMNTPATATTPSATAAPSVAAPATTDTSATSSDADASTATPTTSSAPTATATLDSKSGTTITGTAQFVESNGGVAITVNIKGAAPGDHGVHLHETPDCSSADGKSAGGHWNPDNTDHGGPLSAKHHAGDFGNVTIAQDGTGTLTLTMPGLTVAPGDHSVVGRAIIVHANADDFKTQPTGNAGARGACGVIAAAPASN